VIEPNPANDTPKESEEAQKSEPPVCGHCHDPAPGYTEDEAKSGRKFERGVLVYHCRHAYYWE